MSIKCCYILTSFKILHHFSLSWALCAVLGSGKFALFYFSMANLKIELSKLDSEAWPGALDAEKEKLMLINEKEELLKELQFITPRKRTQDELEQLEAKRKRLEEELVSNLIKSFLFPLSLSEVPVKLQEDTSLLMTCHYYTVILVNPCFSNCDGTW